MVNKRDVEVFIVCLSCHFDVGLFHVIEQEVPYWRFSMVHIYLQWQEPAWDSKSSSMRFGYSYFTGHEVFNLWFVKHMLHNCNRINSNHSRCLWWGQWELKASKYHNFWRFIKLAITASLCEGPFFYFYVESPPSTFMHRLREHSCHSEYNVHCPKVFIDWFIILVSLVLKLFVSSRPLKLEGVLCIYVLLFHERQAENHLLCFSLWFEHTFNFHCYIFMIFRLCSFSCYNMVANFLLSRLYLSCPCFKFFWSQHTMLT
jgi:hypothetical protein